MSAFTTTALLLINLGKSMATNIQSPVIPNSTLLLNSSLHFICITLHFREVVAIHLLEEAGNIFEQR